MKPSALHLTNFGPFTKRQSFYFPDAPGLYFLWGQNLEEPRLEANGAGKTKLWEALTWVLYGKTSKGLKAGDISSWDVGKATKVEFEFEMPGEAGNWCMTRAWSPNSWKLKAPFGAEEDLTKDKTNFVLELLQLDFAPFLHCILMAQGLPMFLDLKADAKAALFAEVMQLDEWLEYSSKASSKASGQDRISRQLEQRVSELRGRLNATAEASVADQAEEWDRLRSQMLDALEKRYKASIADADAEKTFIKKATADLVLLRKHHGAALRELEKCAEVAKEWSAGTRDHELEVDRAEQTYHKAFDVQELLDAGKDCPTCGTKTTSKHREAHRTELEKAAADLRSAEADQRKLLEVEAGAQKVLARAKKEVADVAEAVEDSTRALKDSERKLARFNAELDDMEAQAERLEKEANPYAEIEARGKEEIQSLRNQIRRTEDELDESHSAHSIWSNWVRWFKDIRLQLVGEALQQLELEVNSCLTELGLVDWELHFNIDRESKTGSIQRGFSVTVMSPHNDRPVPWEAWSGGESQRLRLATTQGLANLIRSRSGTALNLEVWDEPTQWLSPQGVQDLLESLTERAKREGRQIWIVDHRSLGFAGFSGSAGVIKGVDGSSTFAQT